MLRFTGRMLERRGLIERDAGSAWRSGEPAEAGAPVPRREPPAERVSDFETHGFERLVSMWAGAFGSAVLYQLRYRVTEPRSARGSAGRKRISWNRRRIGAADRDATTPN